MNIEEAQHHQQAYDDVYYDQRHTVDELSCVRHVTLHLGKLLGKLSTVVEIKEHGNEASSDVIRNEVVPDLFFWALHLANRYNLDLEQVYLDRLAINKKRIEAARKEHHNTAV